MGGEAVLVLDAGTSALRGVLVEATGATRTLGAAPWRMLTPEDAAPFGRELDGAEVGAQADRLIAEAAGAGGRIAAVACTGQREGLVFADEALGAVLVSPNVDARASAEGMRIDAARAPEAYRTTGHLPSLMQAPAKLAWLRANRPADAARVRWVLPLADWIAARLSGAPMMSRTLAVENGLADVASGEVAGAWLSSLGVARELVPTAAADGAAVGETRGGPLAGVPVVLAGADTQCALIGMGAVSPGACGVPCGWSAPAQLVLDAPLVDGEMRTWTGMHAISGAWVLESNAGETGRAWAWLCETLGVSPEEACALAATSPAGARDTAIVLTARRMAAARMNAGLGALTVPLPIVMSAPSRGDVLRSALEATACAVRANIEQLECVSGRQIETVRAGGGMTRAPLFVRILADVLDRPVEVARAPETTALGAAALASVAVGLHGTTEAGINTMTAPRTRLTPDAAASAAYEDVYARWCALADACERLATEA
ncbi:MAG TPA: FGGY-family carbohydrate kinase [Dehalococcoidia bacterium]|nr:FGGY-family carbohydrate kinase [Dehalococcoidia bacterium]